MAINPISIQINHFCVNYINPKITKRIADAQANNQLIGGYPLSVLNVLLHDQGDSLLITLAKLGIYYFEFNGLGNIVEPGVEIAKIYGAPVDSIQESVRWLPQVKVFFRELPKEAWEDNRRPRISEMTVRLNSVYVEALKVSKGAVESLAQIVSQTFKDITYTKGYQKYHYRDLDNNYRLSVFVNTVIEAKTLFTALLNINGDVPNFTDNLVYPKTTKNYAATESKQILGKSIPMPPERTVANMEFWRAELHWKGIYPIILVNNSIKNRGAIIELKYP